MASLLLLPVLVAVATLCAVAVAAGLAWYRTPDTPNGRQQVEGSGNLVGLVVVVAGVLLLGLGEGVVRAVPGPALPGVERTFLGALVGLAASVPVLVGPAVVRRTLLANDPVDEVLVDVAKGSLPVLVLAPLGVLALIAGAKSPFPPVVAVVPPVVAFAYVGASGLVVGSHRTRLPLSEAPSDAVERALDRTGFDPDRAFVLDADREDLWRPFTEGIGRFGRVFVPLSSFDVYDDDELETLLVMLTQRSPFAHYRILTGWGAMGVALALVLGGEAVSTTAMGVGFLALLVLVPAAVWGGRRIAFRQDAKVAATLGADRVVDALAAQDVQRGGDAPSTLALLLTMHPSITERVERLGGDPSRLPSNDDGSGSPAAPNPGPQGAPRRAPPGDDRPTKPPRDDRPTQPPRGERAQGRRPPSRGRTSTADGRRPAQGGRAERSGTGHRQHDAPPEPRVDAGRRDRRERPRDGPQGGDDRPERQRPSEQSGDGRPPEDGRREGGRTRDSHREDSARRERSDSRREDDAQW